MDKDFAFRKLGLSVGDKDFAVGIIGFAFAQAGLATPRSFNQIGSQIKSQKTLKIKLDMFKMSLLLK